MLGIRSTPTNNAHKHLYGENAFGWNPLNHEEIGKVLAMARQIFTVMHDEWGWEPRDLWDVQGFIWETCQKKEPAKMEIDDTPVWLVGSAFSGKDDQTDRFLEDGVWEMFEPSQRNRELTLSMQAGDRIAIKAAFVRRHDVPFDNHDQPVSVMKIKARGTIRKPSEDGISLEVDWDPEFIPREWYFYTYQPSVWKLPLEAEQAQRLVRFIFADEPQDIDWFLAREYWQDRFGKSVGKDALMPFPTNLILYGPPGTGKTYATAREAVLLCDGDADYDNDEDGRRALMKRYAELQQKGRIGFVTFHQNFSYEDFVEGLRPVTQTEDEGGASTGFSLEAQDGVFKQIAIRAQALSARIENVSNNVPVDLARASFFKLSLGELGDPAYSYVFKDSIAEDCAIFGFRDIDWSADEFDDKDAILYALQQRYPDETFTAMSGPVRSTHYFRNVMQVGDIVIAAMGNQKFRAIGVVEGDYRFQPKADGKYCHRRKVKWLWIDPEGRDIREIYSSNFQMNTIYRLKDGEIDLAAIARLIGGGADNGNGPEEGARPLPHVLIIDEINRANISKVFGELITLIEPDKRLGMTNALTVTLPYSKRSFGVPANLHIVGTMNTADRSIALLDTALRRRFTFREIVPEPVLLAEASARTGLPLVQVLATINQRIEFLVDREHRIGHAFFMGCQTKGEVDAVMRDKVIPLLQEYFFEDWKQIWAVLGDGFIKQGKIPPPPSFADLEDRPTWSVREPFASDAYTRLIAGKATDKPQGDEGAADAGMDEIE